MDQTTITSLNQSKGAKWALVIIWMLIIFALSSIQSMPGPKLFAWDFVLKKTAHMIMFGSLFFLIARATNSKQKKLHWNYAAAFIITILYAFSDEYHQSFTPGRSAQLMDVGYDTLGAIITYTGLNGLLT